MTEFSTDQMLSDDNWSDLSQFRDKPEIDAQRLQDYRMGRLQAAMRESDVALCVLVNPIFRGSCIYDGKLEASMVICIESYIGAVGEYNGVKIEQQLLVTEDGYELLTHHPLEASLLD